MHKPGMKIGSGHKWRYKTGLWHETKTGTRKWKFHQTQSKTRAGRSAPYGSGMKTGSKLIWKINAIQVMQKTGPNTYHGYMKGTKKQLGYRNGYRQKIRWTKRRYK